MGITVYINGIGYWFENADDLIELLDAKCNDVTQTKTKDMIVEYDDLLF